MTQYIYSNPGWPNFQWKHDSIGQALAAVRHLQGKLTGRMEALGFNLRAEAILKTLTTEVLKSSEIEGELLNPEQVRSSIARRLGMDIAGLVPSDRNVEGVVEMMLDATQNFSDTLDKARLFNWHSQLFPEFRNSIYKITVGNWRDGSNGPMQVVSGPVGRERVHYQAPDASIVEKEMPPFIKWFNEERNIDPVLKAAIAHLWFITIHPFDDGNGRIARTITDMQLARADQSAQRFYSMSAQIQKQRKAYYDILEATQRGGLDITKWLQWFLVCLENALTASDDVLAGVLQKANFWDKHNQAGFNTRQNLMLNKLLDGFDGKLTTAKWAKIAKCSHDTALRDITELINRNVLTKENAGGRSTSYLISI